MDFTIVQKGIMTALKVVKGSKAFGKINPEKDPILKIDVKKTKVTISATTGVCWCSYSIPLTSFGDPESFTIESEGEILVDGFSFIEMISTYKEDGLIHFFLKEENKGSVLIAEWKSGKRKKTSSFLVNISEIFEEIHIKDKMTSFNVSPRFLKESIEKVEFASSTEEETQFLWCVRLEVFDTCDIAACAGDRKRISWFDPSVLDRKDDAKNIIFPTKDFILPVIKSLDLSLKVEISYGDNYTVIKQESQEHVLPNVRVDQEPLENWRIITQDAMDRIKTKIKIKRKTLSNCIKASTISEFGRYGVLLQIDTNEKEITFSEEGFDNQTHVKVSHKETEPLEDDEIEGDAFVGEMVIPLDSFRDIVNKCGGEHIVLFVFESNRPVVISGTGEKDPYCLCGTIPRIGTGT